MIKHLACQMDGNRRWAQQRGLEVFLGHQKGADTIRPVVQFCLDNSIPFLSLYAFSIENFKRSEMEKKFLFNLISKELERQIDEFMTNGVRVRFLGDRTLFPASVSPVIDRAEKMTAACTKLNVNFLFCYGAQQEIAAAAQQIAAHVARGTLAIDAITPHTIANHLYTRDMPDPEIIVRTGGRNRLSNFLLFQSAYSEYFFLDCLWPDLTAQDLGNVLREFQERRRNFGQ